MRIQNKDLEGVSNKNYKQHHVINRSRSGRITQLTDTAPLPLKKKVEVCDTLPLLDGEEHLDGTHNRIRTWARETVPRRRMNVRTRQI